MLATSARAAKRAGPTTDEGIRARLLGELQHRPWWVRGMSFVSVSDGTVTYSGAIQSEEERDAARIAAENTPGVRRVEDRRLLFRDLPSMV